MFTRCYLLRGLESIKFYITKAQILEDSVKFILILKKEIVIMALLFCDPMHALCLFSAAGVFQGKRLPSTIYLNSI